MIDNEYKLVKTLGSGGSSNVYLAIDSDNTEVAMKIIRKDKKFSDSYASHLLIREHEMLQKLEGHPNIIKSNSLNWEGKLVYHDKTESVMYLVLEYAKHRAISDFIGTTGGLEENIASLYVLQLWNAIAHIHSFGHAHLDIKLENLLLDEFFNLKVGDMGSWVQVSDSNGLTNRRRGTNLYMAPEVYNLKLNEFFDAMAADVYSIGISIFRLLTGGFPDLREILNDLSTSESDQRATDEMMVDSHNIKSIWMQLSKEVRSLILSMLNPIPEERPTIFDVLSHPWLNQEFSPINMEDVYLEMSSREEIIKILKESKSRRH
jgi:serine/threonine protein kinase